jgi:hypothetical protein
VQALARSALTEVATGLSRLSSQCEYLFACEHPSLHRKKKIEEGFGVRFISFLFLFFFFKKKEKPFIRHFAST